MTEFSETANESQSRSIFARIGVTLLNLIHPSLGLFRISQWRFGLVFFLLSFSASALLFVSYHVVHNMTFNLYFSLFGIAFILYLGCVIVSALMTWKNSATLMDSPRWWSRWYGLIVIFLIGSAVTFPLSDHLRSYYKAFFIPAESMQPTFEVNDKFLAKMNDFGEIKRGDILIVRTGTVDYVKRVVALPRDTVALKKGILLINGTTMAQILLETKVNSEPYSLSGQMRILSEQFPGERHPHHVIDLGTSSADDWQQTQMGADEYFFLGDNRDSSIDSRFAIDMMGLGIVSRKRIIGRPLFRYWRAGIGYKEGAI